MNPLKNINVQKDLLFRFFIFFAKFEFSLKVSGFAIGDIQRVSPDWDNYAQSIKDSFDKTVNKGLAEAVDYFLLNPPWRQVLIDGGVAWDSIAPDSSLSEIERVLLLIRRVRNNLFHGGKFNNEVFESKERTERLLNSSLIVLETCLDLIPTVKNNFENATI